MKSENGTNKHGPLFTFSRRDVMQTTQNEKPLNLLVECSDSSSRCGLVYDAAVAHDWDNARWRMICQQFCKMWPI
jgi:hypothetical protein